LPLIPARYSLLFPLFFFLRFLTHTPIESVNVYLFFIRFSCQTALSRRSSKSEVGSLQRRLIINDPQAFFSNLDVLSHKIWLIIFLIGFETPVWATAREGLTPMFSMGDLSPSYFSILYTSLKV